MKNADLFNASVTGSKIPQIEESVPRSLAVRVEKLHRLMIWIFGRKER